MPRVVYTTIAADQLANVLADTRFSERARREMAGRIVRACKDCAAHPLRYPKGEMEGVRRRRVAPFIIHYRITRAGIEVAAIWHERQNRDVRSDD